MASYVEGRGLMAETEPLGLLTESAAGIAVVVLAIIALAGVASSALLAIATIIVGVGLMVQGFNSAAENFRLGVPAAIPDFGGEVMVDCLAGGTGIVLGILALIGVNTAYLIESALIVFGGALLLSGAMAMRGPVSTSLGGDATMVAHRGSFAAGGMEILIGLAAIVLGILSLVLHAAVLTMVGFIAVGAALLLVSATFGSAMLRVFGTAAE